MKKNYNYTRRKLFLPEYGRHIHEMVDSLLSIENRAERTRQAKAVIAVMGNLNPLLRDTADFTHKLWDHLFIMSDFKLDVDSPYPQPSRQELTVVPRKMKYSQSRITFKHYGKYTQQFIRSMAKEPGTPSIDEEMINIARYMRTKSFEYNNEHPDNNIIIKDIRLMAGGSISLDEASIGSIRSEYRTVIPQRMMRNGQRNNKNQGQKNRQNRQQKNNNKNAVRHNSYK
ncbi:MAG: DUF4290 domain-containing protein [Alistipes sp.]|nr:DUF4290 domain-containing protein [Alistipes sp.]